MALTLVQKVAVWIVPVLLAITVHEVAHGWMALRLGDRTAQMLGRLTLNPAKHVDPVGTVLVPGALLVLGGLIMGWARPVPVTVENLRLRFDFQPAQLFAGPLESVFFGFVAHPYVSAAFLPSVDTNGRIGTGRRGSP